MLETRLSTVSASREPIVSETRPSTCSDAADLRLDVEADARRAQLLFERDRPRASAQQAGGERLELLAVPLVDRARRPQWCLAPTHGEQAVVVERQDDAVCVHLEPLLRMFLRAERRVGERAERAVVVGDR